VKNTMVVVEHCVETGLYVGHIPGLSGAHSQGASLEELHENLRQVVAMLLEGGAQQWDAGYACAQMVAVS
jgi:predicted RNase H-like HicB family nuclease